MTPKVSAIFSHASVTSWFVRPGRTSFWATSLMRCAAVKMLPVSSAMGASGVGAAPQTMVSASTAM